MNKLLVVIRNTSEQVQTCHIMKEQHLFHVIFQGGIGLESQKHKYTNT